MIDFRYHLVSIVAVFLALAIGIVVGSTALKPAVLSGLQKTATAEKKRIDALYAQNRQLQQRAQCGPGVRPGVVSTRRWTACWTASGSSWSPRPASTAGWPPGSSSALTEAGATVTGQVQLQSQFFDHRHPVGPGHPEPAADAGRCHPARRHGAVPGRRADRQRDPDQERARRPPARGSRRQRQIDPQRLRERRFPEYQRGPGRPCHPGCRDNPGHPASGRWSQHREPDPGVRRAAAEPG